MTFTHKLIVIYISFKFLGDVLATNPENTFQLMLFTSSRCESCPPVERVFKAISDKYGSKEKVETKMLNCDWNILCPRLKIRAVPTIRLYYNNTLHSFDDEESSYGLEKFVARHLSIYTRDSKIEKASGVSKNFDHFIEEVGSLLFLLLIETENSNNLHPTALLFERLAKQYRTDPSLGLYRFNCAADRQFCEVEKITEPVLSLFYQKVKIEEFNLQRTYQELVMYLSNILTIYPVETTPDYTPTTTVSKDYNNLDLMNSEQTLLLVFSERCVHCRTYLHRWESLSNGVRKYFPDLLVLKLNCKNDGNICSSLRVSAVPTILLLRQGMVVRSVHSVDRVDDLISFIEDGTVRGDL